MNEKSSAHVINYTPIVFTKRDHLMGRIEFFQPCYENSLRPLHKLTVWSCSTRCHKPLIKLCPCLPTPNKLAQTWPLRLSSQSVTSYPPHSRTRHRLAVFHPYTERCSFLNSDKPSPVCWQCRHVNVFPPENSFKTKLI